MLPFQHAVSSLTMLCNAPQPFIVFRWFTLLHVCWLACLSLSLSWCLLWSGLNNQWLISAEPLQQQLIYHTHWSGPWDVLGRRHKGRFCETKLFEMDNKTSVHWQETTDKGNIFLGSCFWLSMSFFSNSVLKCHNYICLYFQMLSNINTVTFIFLNPKKDTFDKHQTLAAMSFL